MPTLKTALVTTGIMLVALFLISRFAPASLKAEIGLPARSV